MDNGQLTTEERDAALCYLRYGRMRDVASCIEVKPLGPGWLARTIAEALKPFNGTPSPE